MNRRNSSLFAYYASFLLSAFGAGAVAFAQDASAGADGSGIAPVPLPLGSVEVVAQRPAPRPAPTAGKSLVTGSELVAAGVETMAEAIELLPGAAVSDRGAAGAQETLSIRGSTANQVLVVVDGLPATDPATGLADLAALGIPLDSVESIELLRGGASAQYGPDAVGGVVIVRTKPGSSGPPSLVLKAVNVSYLPFSSLSGYGAGAVFLPATPVSLVDGQEFSLRAGLPGGLALSAGGERANNAYLYRDANGESRRRLNSDLLGGRLGLAWEGRVPDGRISLDLAGAARSLGVPGTVTAPTPEARQREASLRASLGYETEVFISEALSFDGGAYASASRAAYREDASSTEDIHDTKRAGLDLRWSLMLPGDSKLGFGLAGRWDRLDSTLVKADLDGSAPERLSAGAYVEPALALGSWTLAPALRYDWSSSGAAGFSAGLGLSRPLSAGLSISANANTAYRAPSFDDLYWPESAGVAGNPDLSPERATGGDIGLEFKKERLALSAFAYCRFVQGVILWQPDTGGTWRPTNYGDALYPGLESELRLREGSVTLRLAHTFLYSYVLSGGLELSDGKRVPMVPVHAFDASFSYEKEALSASASLSYAGLRYKTTENRDYLPARLVVNAGLRWALSESLSGTLDAKNLFDERYESVQGFPMPGFSLRAGVELKLSGKKQ